MTTERIQYFQKDMVPGLLVCLPHFGCEKNFCTYCWKSVFFSYDPYYWNS